MGRVPPMRDYVLAPGTCDRLLGIVWVRRGFWRRPVARRFECGSQLVAQKGRVWCPLCAATPEGATWESQPAPRTAFTLTEKRRRAALVAALQAGGLL